LADTADGYWTVASPRSDRRLARWDQLGQIEADKPDNCSLYECNLAHMAGSERRMGWVGTLAAAEAMDGFVLASRAAEDKYAVEEAHVLAVSSPEVLEVR
jgi:hypothetical protein